MPAASLNQIVRTFDTNPMAATRAARDLASANRDTFRNAAIELLRGPMEERSHRFVTSLLLAAGFCDDVIADPHLLPLAEAIRVARSAAALDPMLESRLGSRLLRPCDTPRASEAAAREILRLLDVFAAISGGARLLSVIGRLTRHAHPHVRSKAVLLLGRRNQNVKWAREQMNGDDGRTRANALEAMWGTAGEDARAIYLEAARDANNRVAGNAVVGLYRLNDPAALALIAEMSESGSASRRSTAAWAIGETGDERFSPLLDRMTDGAAGNEALLRNICRAREKVAARTALIEAAPSVQASGWETGPGDFRLGLVAPDGGWLNGLGAVELHLSGESGSLWRYTVCETPPSGPRGIALVVPSSLPDEALAAAMNLKQRDDAWAIVRYGAAGQAAGGDSPSRPPDDNVWFVSRAGSAEAAIRACSREPAGAPQALLRLVRNQSPKQRRIGLVMIAGEAAGDAETDDFLQAAGGTVTVHGIASPNSPSVSGWLGRLASSTGGSQDAAAASEGLEQALLGACIRAHAQYELRVEETEAEGAIHLAVRSPLGKGRTTIRSANR